MTIKKVKKVYKNEPKRIAIIENITNGMTVTKACRLVKISSAAYYKWLKRPEFRKKIEEAEKSKIQIVEDALFNQATGYDIVEEKVLASGKIIKTTRHILADTTAQIFWLCNRASGSWKNLNETKHIVGKELFDTSLESISKIIKEIKSEKEAETEKKQ